MGISLQCGRLSGCLAVTLVPVIHCPGCAWQQHVICQQEEKWLILLPLATVNILMMMLMAHNCTVFQWLKLCKFFVEVNKCKNRWVKIIIENIGQCLLEVVSLWKSNSTAFVKGCSSMSKGSCERERGACKQLLVVNQICATSLKRIMWSRMWMSLRPAFKDKSQTHYWQRKRTLLQKVQ